MKKQDYCTKSPDTIRGVYIGDCCKTHDLDYTLKKIGRREADKKLYRCIKNKGFKIISLAYYIAVRLFGFRHY